MLVPQVGAGCSIQQSSIIKPPTKAEIETAKEVGGSVILPVEPYHVLGTEYQEASETAAFFPKGIGRYSSDLYRLTISGIARLPNNHSFVADFEYDERYGLLTSSIRLRWELEPEAARMLTSGYDPDVERPCVEHG